jgi:hypothetical protein
LLQLLGYKSFFFVVSVFGFFDADDESLIATVFSAGTTCE